MNAHTIELILLYTGPPTSVHNNIKFQWKTATKLFSHESQRKGQRQRTPIWHLWVDYIHRANIGSVCALVRHCTSQNVLTGSKLYERNSTKKYVWPGPPSVMGIQAKTEN